jgi:two-component system response regulator YesN
MYRLLTADDELDKLEALRNNYDWEKYDIELCGEARNGMDTYEQIVKKKPDICIIDIKMPVISGLEAMRRAKKEGIRTKYIVLSGYDEFEYAKEALSLSTVEYLLKPCRPDDIIQAVLKSISIIEEEGRQNKILTDYQRLLEGNAENSKQQFLASLICGEKFDEMEEKIDYYNLGVLRGDTAVCIIAVYDDGGEQAKAMDNLLTILIEVVKQQISEIFACEIFVYNAQIVVLASMDKIAEKFDKFYNMLETAIKDIVLKYGLFCTAGVSDLKSGVLKLHEAYIEAQKTVNASMFLFNPHITFFAEMDDTARLKYPDKYEENILSDINCDERELSRAVDMFILNCRFKSTDAKKQIQEIVINLIYDVYKSCAERDAKTDGLSGKKSGAVKAVLECDNIESIKQILFEFLKSISKSLSETKCISPLIKKAVAYLHENYAKRITLEQVAEEIHVTPSYLSMLFKHQTGLNLIDYLNRYRIEKSKDLIRKGDLKIYEIAYKVGFRDEKYFHMMFKRYTGLTSTQLRDGVFEAKRMSSSFGD